MSSTNRGAARNPRDFYATPRESFRVLLPFICNLPQPIWEPACGDNRLVEMMNGVGKFAMGNDLERGYDFLQDTERRTTIVTNPPFSIAQEFCDHAIKHADHVVMLLRLNFLGSQKRAAWWRANGPSAIFVLSHRPDFTGGGGDSCEYGWFYWSKSPIKQGIFHL